MKRLKPTTSRGGSRTAPTSPATAKTLPLLVEIGCEEIPARFLAGAKKEFAERLKTAIEGTRILGVGALREASPLKTYSTPRRLVAYAAEILERQPDRVETLQGPPVTVAFDASGKPTRAAESFAEKSGVRVENLERVTTPKGEYLAIKKATPGRKAAELLSEILPQAVAGISFPKSMYWEPSKTRFIRPIRWLLALLGEGAAARVILFEVAGVKSGSQTFGHRRHGTRGVCISSFKNYSKKLQKLHVELDPQKRLERVRRECKVLLEGSGWRVVPDPGLEEWIVNSTEWPRGLFGEFDPRFLRLPREILVTVMRDHQKYFGVEDSKGSLQARFVAIINVDGDPKGLIRAGHERVLAARFADAQFFWDNDLKTLLENRYDLLAGITFQEDLGSYQDKVQRMRRLAGEICSRLETEGKFREADIARVALAVKLCKCDLTTQMVQEFPELQGIVGGLYARAQRFGEEVADAIYDHYLPKSMEDDCPRSAIGAVVSLSDKIDSVAGGFAFGREPTGSSDPFALRRQANGVIKILAELALPIPLTALIEEALVDLDVRWQKPREEVLRSVVEFFRERLRYYLETRFRYDTVRAVLGAGWDPPLEALERAEALEAIRGGEDFQALCAAAKRIRNILTKSASGEDWQLGEVDQKLVEGGPESELLARYGGVASAVASLWKAGQYQEALEKLAELRPAVDRFFDKVLVMAEDNAVRQNRLRLLRDLNVLFSEKADLSEIEMHADAQLGKQALKAHGNIK